MAINQIVHDAYAIAKDASIDSIDVTLDTSKWSKRKQNIIVRAIDTGIADCGWDTAHFVSALLDSYGLGTQRLTIWEQEMSLNLVKPEKVEEVKAYIAAMIRLNPNNATWAEDRFMNALEGNGHSPKVVPIPRSFSKQDKHKFITEYLKDKDEQEQAIRNELINKIRSGHKLTISYTIYKGE